MTYTFSKKTVDENVNAMVLFGEGSNDGGNKTNTGNCKNNGVCGDISVNV